VLLYRRFRRAGWRPRKAADVTAVDLDEQAIAWPGKRQSQSAENQFRHADAFGYMRDMMPTGGRLTSSCSILQADSDRRELEEGTRAHLNLNRLSAATGGRWWVLLTCTCSGLLEEAEFIAPVADAGRQAGSAAGRSRCAADRKPQPADPGQDGSSTRSSRCDECPETEY